ncbi:MAG: RsmB/NOP family class I SAM-dependent RNA methyltransferase [Ruminococcus sp.]|nr:RsmB/NOP family class I SAM-dependent RNA methyltransferase [Ruminococcus sp.]
MEEFFSRISNLLSPEELEIFKNEYKKPSYRGVRVNTLKCSADKPLGLVDGIEAEQVTPFCKDGFYIPADCTFGGNHPLHHAGAVYFQEPSAMSAAQVLAPQRGDKVLDLCAAPGGKSTQLASMLNGTGLLWSNEIVKSRANILLSNIERCGVKNAVVSSCNPEVLCEALEGFFDKVLVDAPCSGEGMFRRDENAKNEWSAEHSDSCATRQLKILESAKKALREGGVLVYSTCTFSYAENEGVVERFLAENPDFELEDCGEKFGRRTLSGFACRIFPMDGGEGHFVARLKKKTSSDFYGFYHSEAIQPTPKKQIPTFVCDFLKSTFYDTSPYERLLLHGDKVYALPADCPDIKGKGVLRAGVYVGNIKKNYFEPEHHLFMSADINNVKQVVDLSLDDERVTRFLKGEEIPVEDTFKGYTAVAVEGVITGFGKVSSGRLKNKYPKGLRLL